MREQHVKPVWTMLAVNWAAVLANADFEIGAGARYRERGRYGDRYGERYGSRYGVGQNSSVPVDRPTNGGQAYRASPATNGGGRPNGCVIVDGPCNASHGRAWYKEHGYSCEVKPPRCNCHVIGGNTLNNADFPNGVATGAQWTITLDSGDAAFFVPYYIFLQAFETGAVANLAITGNPVPTILQDSLSGREPNLRRASTTDPSFGIITTVYGQEKEIECVDWNRFASVNRQQLTLIGQNVVDVAVHVFANIWGLPAA
jgi:hypothetical protein